MRCVINDSIILTINLFSHKLQSFKSRVFKVDGAQAVVKSIKAVTIVSLCRKSAFMTRKWEHQPHLGEKPIRGGYPYLV